MAIQLSPLIPGSAALEDQPDGSFGRITIRTPPGVLDRRYVLAHALRALAPGGELVALAPKDRGGARLFKELSAFGCAVGETAKRHYRICRAARPAQPTGLEQAIAEGGQSVPPALGLWSQPGLFSWDRPDMGSLMLRDRLPPLQGTGAEFGCGAGLLARAILDGPDVEKLFLIDIDRRAIDAAKRNIADPRADFAWHDLRIDRPGLRDLDFVVMNPPFHDGGTEDRALGEAFIRRAATALKKGGVCWLVANRHLPYEAALKSCFSAAAQVAQSGGYKIYEARK